MVAARLHIDGKTMIPDLLRTAPHLRPVLDRYGLQGCGGLLGPVESVEFFARAHDVKLDHLLGELNVAQDLPAAVPAVASKPSLADTIYRPFFKSGIAIVLTLGAAWGAYLLLRIGFKGDFRAAGLHEINAHGHAQIFGWVGLFVMGAAYQAFPRFKHTSLVGPRWAIASLAMMLTGIIVRSLAEPLAGTWPPLIPVAVVASLLEIVAIGIFAALIIATWKAAGKGMAVYDYYVLSAIVWFFLQSVYETVHLAATLTASSREQLVGLVATWQGALRDMQIHGFALLMILGVSQRVFAPFYGLREPKRRLAMIALVVLNAAIVGEVLGLILMRQLGHAWAGLWYVSALVLAVAVVLLVRDWNVFGKSELPDRNLKFLRAAYVWLLISLAMLALLPAYQFGALRLLAPQSEAATMGFSHAYYGAIRHAITVGFVSMMIVGMAGKMAPTLNGIDVHGLRPLWLPFLLLNAGCATRVLFQTLTDFTPFAYRIAGISGLLEVTALAIWGAHIWGVMDGRVRARPDTQGRARPYYRGEPIAPNHVVGDVLEHHPELLQTFVLLGFRPLANPILRRVLAETVTIDQACRYLRLNSGEILKTLNSAIGHPAATRLTLGVVDQPTRENASACMPRK